MALKETEFIKFFGKVHTAHTLFSLWLHLTNEIAKPDRYAATKDNLFWKPILPVFQHSWILALARIFDPPYYDMKCKLEPRLSLDYISQSIGDQTLSESIKSIKRNHECAIKSIKHHRRFIAHNPLGEIHNLDVNPVEYLFKDLEKIILEIGWSIGHDLNNDSLYTNYYGLQLLTDDEAARLSVRELFAGVMNYRSQRNTLIDDSL